MGQRLHHRRGRPRQQIRHANLETPILQLDETIRVGKPAELEAQAGQSRARLQLAEDPRKNLFRALKKERSLKALNVQHAVEHPVERHPYVILPIRSRLRGGSVTDSTGAFAKLGAKALACVLCRAPGQTGNGSEDHARSFAVAECTGAPRSEERRVGKECRSRWWSY